MRILLVIAAAVLTCAGCIPFTVFTSPKIDGEIVDSATNAAIPAATIVVHPGFQAPYDGSPTTVTSGADGRFLAPEITRRIWLPPLPYDFAYPNALVSVTTAGYEPQEQTLYALLDAQPPGVQRPIVIRLKHQ